MVEPVGETRKGRWTAVGSLPLGRTLRLVLVGLMLALAAITAAAIGNLYDARQDYEDKLARSYQVEVSSSHLLAAGIVEETALAARGRRAARVRRRAAAAFAAQAQRTRGLASGDRTTRRLVEQRIALQRRARRQARRRGAARSLARTLGAARQSDRRLSARQAQIREGAREQARDDSRRALLTAGIAGGLALLGTLALVTGLVASIRRPLEDLVRATGRLARGELGERVRPGGPEELTDLGSAFNVMAEQLGTARSRIEREREKLATTIESLGDALVVCNTDGTVSAVNRRAELVVPELRPGVRDDGPGSPLPPLEEALEGEVMRERDERTLAITAAPLGKDGSEGVVWTIRDVSERARLERLKSDFVATASHELRSPLTSIKGFVELLARSQELASRDREFVAVILQSTDRLVELVNDLLDVARLDAGKMEVHPRLFDLGEVVHEVVRLMEPRFEAKRQEVDVRVPTGLPRALADPARVRQIVTNLVSNAHLYTQEGGHIGVRLAEEDGRLALQVVDDGRGMSEQELERIFERFVTRADGSGGTGLGLAITRSLVELQHGSIDVESTLGEGTTFSVRLPAGPPPAEATAPRESIRGKRVLVVDDEESVTQLLCKQLERFDVQASPAHSGDEALERLRAERFDAMTIDVLMPGRSGLDVLRALRKDPERRNLPVVVVSILAGGDALLGEWRVTKPVDPEELADALGAAVTAGRTRVLVVGRSSLQPQLEPALVRLGLEHEWVMSGTAAAHACGQSRFEVALVDAGLRDAEAVLRALDLRGRRVGRAVLLLAEEGDVEGLARYGAEVVPIERAGEAVLGALAEHETPGGPGAP